MVKKIIKGFVHESDYMMYKSLNQRLIITEKKLYKKDLETEKSEEPLDSLVNLPNSLKYSFNILEEVANLKVKDSFGEISIQPKAPLYFKSNIDLYPSEQRKMSQSQK